MPYGERKYRRFGQQSRGHRDCYDDPFRAGNVTSELHWTGEVGFGSRTGCAVLCQLAVLTGV